MPERARTPGTSIERGNTEPIPLDKQGHGHEIASDPEYSADEASYQSLDDDAAYWEEGDEEGVPVADQDYPDGQVTAAVSTERRYPEMDLTIDDDAANKADTDKPGTVSTEKPRRRLPREGHAPCDKCGKCAPLRLFVVESRAAEDLLTCNRDL